ncbi:hypothetical protein M7I_5516 [Glarea lozoyensis 74030]|uniref:B30.2/SPRY domain-containing protein n=1 Tax=Glarea lozoyensis (strain ATCC 74030 / MF5533) TaxID=1104152 RepID=H0ES41_GLAL7|nr:hypothetical protein M7I_5516 [Glarea lozoyensis 74030]
MSDGQEVKLTGPKPDRDRDHEASSIGIGFSSKTVPLSRLPGWEPDSWAYHGDDGHSFGSQSTGKHYGPPFTATDVIGCGVNFRTGSAFFTKNGDNLDGMMSDEKRAIHQEIASTSTAKLAPPMNETDLIQSLPSNTFDIAQVLQFLTHDGYIETARAFADEVHSEKSALALDKTTVVESFSVKEDKDAGHRQQMVRRGAEMLQSNHKHTAKKSNGQNGDWHDGDWHDDVMNQDMEMDNQQNNNNYDRMDTEEGSDNLMEYNQLTQATLNYGQDLERQYRNDPSREVSKALSDAFSLIAYQDPLNRKEVSHLVDPKGRVAVAEELNAAILLSLGKSSSAALEKLYQQTAVLLEDLRDGGGSGAFVNIDDFARPKHFVL